VTPTLPEQPLPIFQGSTSSLFCITVVDTNLKVLEHDGTGPLTSDDGDSSLARTTFSIVHGEIINEVSNEVAEGESENRLIVSLPRAAGTRSQPIQTQTHDDLDRNDLISLVHVYQNLAGILYPILNIAFLVQQARDVWATWPAEPAPRKGGVGSSLHQIGSSHVAILKMVAAIALLAEGDARYDLALSLYESLLPDVEAMVWSSKVDLKGLILLTLVVLHTVTVQMAASLS
jgi:hypothetical protein